MAPTAATFDDNFRYPMTPHTRSYIDRLAADIIIRGGEISAEVVWNAPRYLHVGEMQIKVGTISMNKFTVWLMSSGMARRPYSAHPYPWFFVRNIRCHSQFIYS
jgi:hypothetical protein